MASRVHVAGKACARDKLLTSVMESDQASQKTSDATSPPFYYQRPNWYCLVKLQVLHLVLVAPHDFRFKSHDFLFKSPCVMFAESNCTHVLRLWLWLGLEWTLPLQVPRFSTHICCANTKVPEAKISTVDVFHVQSFKLTVVSPPWNYLERESSPIQ